MASPSFLSDGHTPARTDTLRIATEKILGALIDGGGSGGGVGAVYSGNYGGGAPSPVPTASAAIAYDLDAPYTTWKWDGAAWT